MKRQILKICLLTVLFLLFILVSHFLDYSGGVKISNNFWLFFKEMIMFLPLMFILIGLFDVWIPKEKIERHIGNESGIKGIFWVVILATFQGGPLYVAFPVAYLLWKKGCRIRNIFIYLGAFSALKIPMLTFEIGFLGLKFSLFRTMVSLPVFILIGQVMEFYLRNKDYQIKQP